MLGIGIGIGKRHPVIGAGGGGGAFSVNAVHFDGTNDKLNRGAELTGAVDGTDFLFSLWMNIAGSPDDSLYMFRNSVVRMLILRNASNKIQVQLRNNAGGVVWSWSSDDDFTNVTNSGWHHLLVAAELDVTPVGHVFLDDVALAITAGTAPTAGDLDWTSPDSFVGFRAQEAPPNDDPFNGDMAEFYLTNEFLDISVEANRRKFIDAAGKPVDLGADGSTPTGTAPLIYLSGDTDTWHTNDGSGGGFTEVGALTDAASSPSD